MGYIHNVPGYRHKIVVLGDKIHSNANIQFLGLTFNIVIYYLFLNYDLCLICF